MACTASCWGGTIVGAEPTPLLAYFAGLQLGQGALLLLVTGLSQRVLAWLGQDGRRLAGGIWIGIGCAFAWVALIPKDLWLQFPQTAMTMEQYSIKTTNKASYKAQIMPYKQSLEQLTKR